MIHSFKKLEQGTFYLSSDLLTKVFHFLGKSMDVKQLGMIFQVILQIVFDRLPYVLLVPITQYNYICLFQEIFCQHFNK